MKAEEVVPLSKLSERHAVRCNAAPKALSEPSTLLNRPCVGGKPAVVLHQFWDLSCHIHGRIVAHAGPNREMVTASDGKKVVPSADDS